MFLPGSCGCCARCSRPYCSDELTQAVIAASFPGGGGLQSVIYRSDGVQEAQISCPSGVDERIWDLRYPNCFGNFFHDTAQSSTLTSSTLDGTPLPQLGGTFPLRRVGIAFASPISPGFQLASAPSAYGETVGLSVNVSLSGVEGPQAYVRRTWNGLTGGTLIGTNEELYVQEIRQRLKPRCRFEIESAFGRNAELALNMQQGEDGWGRPVWNILGVTVVNGGNGYQPGMQNTRIHLFWENIAAPPLMDLFHTIGFPDEGANAGKILSVTFPQFTVLPQFGLSGFRVQRTVSQPSITASCGNAVLQVATTQRMIRNDIYWGVSAINIVTGDCAIENGQSVSFTASGSDVVVETPAEAYANVERIAPTLTASVASGSGSGAAFTVSTTSNGGDPETWGIGSVSVTNGGSGYPAQGYLAIAPGTCGVAEQGAAVLFSCTRVQPTVSASMFSSTQGIGAAFSVTLTQGVDWWTGLTMWYVSSVSVTNGGSGYTQDEEIEFVVADGQAESSAYATASVDENGAIISATLYYGGVYYKSSGVISQAVVEWPGEYYKRQLNGFVITNQGAYVTRIYEEVVSEPLAPAICNGNPLNWTKYQAKANQPLPTEYGFRYQDPADNATICLSPPSGGGCGFSPVSPPVAYRRCGLPNVSISIQ